MRIDLVLSWRDKSSKFKLNLLARSRSRNRCTYNPGQSIWNKIEKSSKTGEVKKSLISTFACFWTAIASLVSGRETGH